MSDISTILMDQVKLPLAGMAGQLADGFLGGLEGVLRDAPVAARTKVEDLVKVGFSFKHKALVASSVEEAREYAEAVEKAGRRVKTVLLAERIVAEESVASMIADLFMQALNGLVTIAKGLVSAVASGIASGALSGIMGGEGGGGFDPSSIFPFA